MQRIGNSLVVIVKAGFFYAAFTFAAAEIVAINLSIAPEIPWSMVAFVALAAFWISTVGRRWSPIGFAAIKASRPVQLAWIIFASVGCMSLAIVGGALFHLRATSLTLGRGPPELLEGAYALMTPLGAAFVEEFTFRGILQGNFERIASPRLAMIVASGIYILSHAWQQSFVAQFGLYVGIAIATSWIVYRTHSLSLATAVHAAVNILFASATLMFGPISLDSLGSTVTVATAIIGVLAWISAGWCTLLIPPHSRKL